MKIAIEISMHGQKILFGIGQTSTPDSLSAEKRSFHSGQSSFCCYDSELNPWKLTRAFPSPPPASQPHTNQDRPWIYFNGQDINKIYLFSLGPKLDQSQLDSVTVVHSNVQRVTE